LFTNKIINESSKTKERVTFMKYLVLASVVIISCFAKAETQVQLEVEIPRLSVAEYHKPYVAIWLEDSKRKVTQIAVWYDLKMDNRKGEEWLADLRQWWRRGGRDLSLPIDGVTSATKGPGIHLISDNILSLLNAQVAGDYKIRVEAAREVGGREIVDIPITLPLKLDSLPKGVSGNRELGSVRFVINNLKHD